MMLRFSQSFSVGTVKFLAANELVSAGGGSTAGYADPSAGVAVSANVQPVKVSRSTADGVDRFHAEFVVCLLDNPASLNGGLGVARDDAFWWSLDGRLLIAQGDAVRVGTVWRVKCVASQ